MTEDTFCKQSCVERNTAGDQVGFSGAEIIINKLKIIYKKRPIIIMPLPACHMHVQVLFSVLYLKTL